MFHTWSNKYEWGIQLTPNTNSLNADYTPQLEIHPMTKLLDYARLTKERKIADKQRV